MQAPKEIRHFLSVLLSNTWNACGFGHQQVKPLRTRWQRLFSCPASAPLAMTLALTLGLVAGLPAMAHEAAPHVALLSKTSDKVLLVRMALDPALVLHKCLADKTPIADFVARTADMPAADFAKLLPKAQRVFGKDLYIDGPDGKRLTLRNWRWPDAAQWQQSVQLQWITSKAQANEPGHGPQIEVTVEAVSQQPIAQLRLALPASSWPILVKTRASDQFWLTDKIPMELVQF